MNAPASLDLIQSIRDMRGAGKSWLQIADATGRNLESVLQLAATYSLSGIGVASFWNPGRKARAIQMAKDGYSASQIGADLGCTRNAVVGKLGRAHVKLHGTSGNPHGNQTKRRPRPPKGQQRAIDMFQPKVVEERMCDLVVEPSPKTWVFFVDRKPNECCWPSAGEPGPRMRVCGAEIAHEWIGFRSYCQFHHEKSRVGGRVR